MTGAPAWGTTACDPDEKAPGIAAGEVKLGATMPLTGSATAGGLGVSAGARTYYDMINAAGGIKGRKVSYIVLDDEYKPAAAQQQMRALVQRDRVFAIAGGEGTPNFLAVVPLLEREKVPAIGPYAPSSELGTMRTPHVFMTAVTYVTEFAIMTKHVMETAHPQSLSLVGVQGNVGDDAKAGMGQGAGPAVKLTYIPEVPGTPDFTPIATQLRDAAAPWTFLSLTNADTGQLLQAMQRIGYKPQTAAWPGMDDPDYLKAFAPVSQGMVVAEETAPLDSADPAVRKFVADFTKLAGHAPSKFEELGWSQAQLVVKALQDAKALTRSCLMEAPESMRDFQTGILPPITFGPDRRQGVNAVGLVKIRGDKTVEVVPFRSLDQRNDAANWPGLAAMTSYHLAGAAQVTLSGLATGSLYAVLLLGVIPVFQVSKNINFAYGQTGIVGAFASCALYADAGVPVWLALLVGAVLAIAVAALTDLLIIRNIPVRPGFDLVVTLGELLLLTALAQMAFGTSAQSYLKLLTDVAGVRNGVFINANDLLCIALGVLAAVGGHVLLAHTSLGVSLRTSAAHAAIAQSVGIRVQALRTAAWAVSGLLVCLGAMLFAARLSMNAFYMTPVMINVFIAGMIGGLDRYWPPMLAAFGIAVCQSWATYLFGEAGGTPALFVLVILVMGLVPRRHLEERHEARA